MILNALEGKPLPIYGDGLNIRDWLYVDDHCYGIWLILRKGRIGETYNIGGNNEKTNIDLVTTLCELMDKIVPVADNPNLIGREIKSYKDLITFVKDRPGHDRRHAIDAEKIKKELGCAPAKSFQTYLGKTLRWYLENRSWCQSVMDGSYREWV